MRAHTGGELTRLSLNRLNFHLRVWIADHTGALVNFSALTGNDWIQSAGWGETQDQPVSTATVRLKRAILAASLAPLMAGSALNAGGAAIDTGRRITIETATTDPAVAPVGGDWKTVFDGKIDDIDWDADPIVITCRDQGAWLQAALIELQGLIYGTTGGRAVESVIQDLIDDWVSISPPTLSVPASPGWNIFEFVQDRKNVLDAIRDLALQIGWDLRYRWNAANQFLLTLYDPGRTNTTSLYTFTKDEYLNVTQLKLSDADIRNAVAIVFTDRVLLTERTRIRIDAASITAYRRRYFEIGHPTNIGTLAEADILGDAVLADLSTPFITHEIETFYWWMVQLGDLYTFQANGVHYDADQKYAIVGYQHEFTEDHKARTKLLVRGNPSGAYRDWLKMQGGGGGIGSDVASPPPIPSIRLVSNTSALVTVEVDAQVDYDEAPVSWRYRVVGDPTRLETWSVPVSGGLPTQLQFFHPAVKQASLEFEVTQADAQVDTARFPIPGQMTGVIDGGSGRVTEDDHRSGIGGVPTPNHRVHAVDQYDATGSVALIDSLLGRLTTDIAGPTGITSTVIERGGNKGDGGFTGLTGQLATTSVDSRAALLNNHFRYSVDGAVGVVESGTQSFTHPTYLDGSRRPITMRDGSVDVVAADINVGQARARGGFTGLTGQLATTSVDSRSALMNAMFRYSVDASDGIVDGTGSPLSGGKRGQLALNVSNKLQTGVDPLATGSDGYANIESRRGAAKQAGHAATGLSLEGDTRGGRGGLPVYGQQFRTDPYYDITGAVLLLDTLLMRLASGLSGPTGIAITTIETGGNRANSALDANNRLVNVVRQPMLAIGGTNSYQSGGSPLSSTNLVISIATHSVYFGGSTTVSYTGGSVTVGSATTWYVYADDPTFAGGAVTYAASTTKATLSQADGRYYVGQITTVNSGSGSGASGGGGGVRPV